MATPSSSPRRVSWVRWLARHGLPRDHIIFVLELDAKSVVAFDRWLDWVGGKGPPPRRPKPKSRYHAGTVRQVVPGIRGTGSNKLRLLTELGYPPATIAHLLGVRVEAVRRYQRRGSAERPPPSSPWYAPGDARRTVEPPAAELVHDQVEVEAPPPAAELVDHQVEVPAPPPSPWIGPASVHDGGSKSKLSELEALEIHGKRSAGWSVHELARDYEVSRNTIYAALKRTDDAPIPSPSEAERPENGQ